MKYSKTLDDWIKAVKRKLLIPDDQESLEWSDDLIIDLVHEGRTEFWNRLPASARNGVKYVNSTVDTREYTISEDVDIINFIVFNNGTRRRVLRFISEQKWAQYNYSYVSGDVVAWTKRGNSFLTYPAANATVTNGFELWGRVGLTRLTEITDSDGNIQDRWFPMIVDYIAGLCWEEAEQNAKANAKYVKFEKRMSDNAPEILSSQTSQDVTTFQGPAFIDETDERRWGHLTSP